MNSPSTRRPRRAWLRSLAAGFTLGPICLRAAEHRRPRLSFVVVSDTHLGYRDRNDAAELWERTATEIAQAPGELVLHLGDVVDGGREAQYPVYLDIRKRIAKPVHEIPGNHDPAELFAKYIREQVDTVVEHQWIRFLLLNNSRRDSHDGFLSEPQVEWLNRQCAEAQKRDQFVAIAMHVPAHTNAHPDRGWHIKPENGQRSLYELAGRHRDRVLFLVHGHFHNGIRGWDDHAPLHEIAFPSALYNQDRRLTEQQAIGYNLPEFRPGYTLVAVEHGQIRLQYVPVGVKPTVSRTLTTPAGHLHPREETR
jgi:calcineurin-like phosphoesterase family protein